MTHCDVAALIGLGVAEQHGLGMYPVERIASAVTTDPERHSALERRKPMISGYLVHLDVWVLLRNLAVVVWVLRRHVTCAEVVALVDSCYCAD